MSSRFFSKREQRPSPGNADPLAGREVAPGKVTRTSKLPPSPAQAVQRKPQAGATGGESIAPARSAREWTTDPSIEAALCGTPLPERSATTPVQAKEAPGTEHEHLSQELDAQDAPALQGGGSKSGVLSAEAARKLLQDAFGAYRQISAGNVKVLPQAEFQVAYDAIYGKTQWAWDTYVKPTFGNLNGFAHAGVNYINENSANVTTVPHEMLHNNAAADWRPFVGSPFDEGATEYLEQHALKKGGIQTTLTHYPSERSVVEAYLASGTTEAKLFEAYLKGGASTIVGKWVDDTCKGAWTDVKSAMEQQQWATAKAHLAKK